MSRKPKKKKETKAPEQARDDRDPAVIRAEKIRGAAGRETVEAFVVAFILALLFRGFIAEAFVIPTGSMAPTLMGAHKDLTCDRCSMTFPVGASSERNKPVQPKAVIGGVCPNCRHANAMRLNTDANHATFNGDRILVSKFSYALSDPERWDVIVFKFPGNPKQNYIKRLVGLPMETLTLSHGDVYARRTGTTEKSQMLRKTPDKILSMSNRVSDTNFQSPVLINAKYPSRWQPWEPGATKPPTDSWQIDRSEKGLVATLKPGDDTRQHWLRYFHRFPNQQMWEKADNGLSLANVDPYSSGAITDFYAYDSSITVPTLYAYDEAPSSLGRRLPLASQYSSGVLKEDYNGPEFLKKHGPGRLTHENGWSVFMGMHWVGDLIAKADVQLESDAKELTALIVEAGIEYTCTFDLATGTATLGIGDADQKTREFSDASGKTATNPSAQTSVTAGTRHSIRFANVDDKLTLWVDDEVIEFNAPTTFDVRDFRTDAEDRPYYFAGDPLDAAPVGFAVKGGQATIHQLTVDRDKYYIPTKVGMMMDDYQGNWSDIQVRMVLRSSEQWDSMDIWRDRRSVEFELQEDQFFPMGDNSPESLDARCWAGSKAKNDPDPRLRLPTRVTDDAYAYKDAWYVPRDLLVGKALVVFWPHYWNAPIPFMPNFKRMQLIR